MRPPAGPDTDNLDVDTDETSRQIRGSSLLLLGRVFSLAIEFAVHVLIVRYLTKLDYGAFAFGLALASVGSTFLALSLDKAITRFVPIYDERGDYDRLFGTVVLMIATILTLGVLLVVLVQIAQVPIRATVVRSDRELIFLLILIGLAPIHALGGILGGLMAIYASPRIIFWRRHFLGPGIQIGVVLALILIQADPIIVAVGYLGAALLAPIITSTLLVRILREQGLLAHFRVRTLKFPIREVFGFALPLLASDLVFLLRGPLVPVILGFFQGPLQVASYRAVLTPARQNSAVYQTFSLLFAPRAARLFERGALAEIDHLYWQTARWIALITFPIFAVTFSLAGPITVLLFGSEYADAGIILALLAVGFYFSAALGFNGLTLRTFGRVRSLLAVDAAGAVISAGVYLALIPTLGAVGAAIGSCATLVLQNVLYQEALRRATGISPFRWRHVRFYLSLVLAAVALLLFQQLLSPPVLIGLIGAAVVSLAVLGINRNSLAVGETFPQLLRIPLLRSLLPR